MTNKLTLYNKSNSSKKFVSIGTGTIETIVKVASLKLASMKIVYESGNETIGGSAVNIALHLRKLGIDAVPLFPYGNDELGRKLTDKIISETGDSINQTILPSIVGATTNESTILVGPQGKRGNISKTGSGQNCFPELIENWFSKNIDRVGAVIISHIRQESTENSITIKLFHRIWSYSQDIPVFFNPGISQFQNGINKYRDILCRVNILQLGANELLNFVSNNDTENADWFSAFDELYKIVPVFIVTFGKLGAIVCKKEGMIYYVPAYPVVGTIRDTTGAGDAFLAGTVYGYIMKMNKLDSLECGRRLSALICQYYGGAPQGPSKNLLLSLDEKARNIEPIRELTYDEFRKHPICHSVYRVKV